MKHKDTSITDLLTLTWEETSPCSYKVTVAVPAQAVDVAAEGALNYIAGAVQMPGFRRGQVPKALIKGRYKDEIQHDVNEAVLTAAAYKLTTDGTHKIIAYGIPESETIEFKQGEDSTVAFDVDVAPKFELPEYKGLEVKIESEPVTDATVDQRLTQLREAFGEFKKVDDKLQKDDIAQVAYSADVTLPEDAPASLKAMVNAESTWLWIGETDRIPGASAAMLGKKAGDTVTFDATFPEDATEPFLAGKTLKYEIKINDAQRRLPLTDDAVLCQRFNVDDMDAVMARLRADIEEERKSTETEKVMTAIRDQLSAAVPTFPLPPATLGRRTTHFLREIARETVKSDADRDAFTAALDEHEKEAKARAEKALHAFFILSAIAEKEEITVTQQEVEDRIAMIAQYLRQTVEETKRVIRERNAEGDVSNDLLEQKTLAFIADNAKVNS